MVCTTYFEIDFKIFDLSLSLLNEVENFLAFHAQIYLITNSSFGVPVPPLVPGGGTHSLAGAGVRWTQFRRGDRHCGILGIDVLYFVLLSVSLELFLLDVL